MGAFLRLLLQHSIQHLAVSYPSDDGMKSVPVVPVRTIDESELLEVAFKFIVTDQEVPMIFCYRLQQYFNNTIVKGQ